MAVRGERILVLDPDASQRRAIAGALTSRGLAVVAPEHCGKAAERLSGTSRTYGLLIVELNTLGDNWTAKLARLKQQVPETEVIVTAHRGSIEAAVQAMREGAYDFLHKPLDLERLPVLVERALEKRRLAEENRSLRERLSIKDEYGNVVGKSARISEVYDVVGQVAATNATVLLTGESGTGKERVARALHKRSDRRERLFVSINCGALPEGLLESELFGFERGAFTGAVEGKAGKIELAHEGTLFLDEVGEMSPKTQVEFLRVLQEKEFRRLGGEEVIRVNVRIIAATNKDLLEEVNAGRFRQDLYYRLAVVPIHMPPLRERREDIPLLVDAFLKEFAQTNAKRVKKLTREAMELLMHYRWPGNIRELRNVIERMTVIVDAATICPEHLPPEVASSNGATRQIFIPLGTPLRKVEELVIRRTLEEVTDHRQKAAQILGISPRALHYKIARYGVARKRSSPRSRRPRQPQPA
ncbi:MAG: sigma-54-dependent transcriptional regulator [Acidobacteriota bacterium]